MKRILVLTLLMFLATLALCYSGVDSAGTRRTFHFPILLEWNGSGMTRDTPYVPLSGM